MNVIIKNRIQNSNKRYYKFITTTIFRQMNVIVKNKMLNKTLL